MSTPSKKIKIMKTRYLVLLLTILTLAGSEAMAQKAKADRMFKRFDFARAIPHYERLANKNNRHLTYAMTRLGDCYRLTSNYEKAAEWYGKVVESSSPEAQVYLNYGQSLRSLGQYDEAREQFERYSQLNPTDSRGALYAKFSSEVKAWAEPEYDYAVTNAGEVNSAFSDFSPLYTADGIIFTTDRMARSGEKRYGWTGAYYLDLFFAKTKKNDEGILVPGSASVYSSKLNQTWHDGPATFSSDFKTVYFTRVIRKSGELDSTRYHTNRLQIFSSTMQDDKWSDPEPFYLNSETYSVGHPALTSDGKTLYFVSDMPGGQGGTDIYRVKRQDDSWGQAENLGTVINTFGNEMFPYVHKDSILYFSSDGHAGLGSLDIFRAQIQGEQFTAPENLKAPVNSPADDFGIAIADNHRQGIFSSNRPGGKGEDDLYLVSIRERLPDSVLIAGIVRDKESLAIMPDATVFALNTQTGDVLVLKTDDLGQYSFTVPRGSVFVIKGIETGFYPDCLNVTLDPKSGITELNNRDLLLAKLKVDQIFKLHNIYYDFDKHNIRPDAAAELDRVVTFLNENPDIAVELGSHTDARGTHRYNDRLSQRRAESAVKYIVERGTSRNRITAQGYGETKLVNECADGINCSEEAHQANRRTEIKISGVPESPQAEGEQPLDRFKAGDVLKVSDFDESFFTSCNDAESLNELPVYGITPRGE